MSPHSRNYDEPRSDEAVAFGRQLRQAREFRELSQREVGEAIGLTQSQVGRHESGTRNISADVLVRYCDLFDWSAEMVFDFLHLDYNAAELAVARSEYLRMVHALKPLITFEESVAVYRMIAGVISRRHPTLNAEDFTGKVYTRPGATFKKINPKKQDMLPEPAGDSADA